MDTRQLIDLIGQGQSAEAKDAISDLLSARAFEALEAHKQEIAQTMFEPKEEIQSAEETATEE